MHVIKNQAIDGLVAFHLFHTINDRLQIIFMNALVALNIHAVIPSTLFKRNVGLLREN